MVNRGRPSKDCAPCRKRKLRCDLKVPGCGQCRRAQLACFGYRDLKDLNFKDETKSTHLKVYNSHQVQKDKPGSFAVPWAEQARMAFFTFFVFGMTQSHDVLAPLLLGVAPGNHLAEAVDAVSLAFFAFHHGRRTLSDLAQEKYAIALRKVNQVLTDPELATTDSVLQSVLLLDLYEKIAHRKPEQQSEDSWMTHVNGAMALIEARGEKNYQTYTSRRLAIRMSVTLSISCNAKAMRMPPHLLEVFDRLEPFAAKNDVKWHIKSVVGQLVSLRADVREGVLQFDAEILEKAWDLEADFAKVDEYISSVLHPVRIELETDDPQVFGRYYDFNETYFQTQGANVFRTMRLMLHDLIESTSGRVVSPQHHSIVESVMIRERAAEGICASVPQYLFAGARPENENPLSPTQVVGCYSLLPALYYAGKHTSNEKLRAWIVRTMLFMADNGGMEMADKTAKVLKAGAQLPYWDVYSMMGSYAFAA